MQHPDTGVFLDRDGTVNVEMEYLSSPSQLQLIPRSARAIQELNSLGLRVFIISNQSGVARGYFTEDRVKEVNAALLAMLKREGAIVDDVYYCPHLPGAPVREYAVECACRKPKPGMLLEAARKHDLRLDRSFVIGDRCIDVETGKAVGAGTVLVATGYGSAERLRCGASADFCAADLYDAVQHVKATVESRVVNSPS